MKKIKERLEIFLVMKTLASEDKFNIHPIEIFKTVSVTKNNRPYFHMSKKINGEYKLIINDLKAAKYLRDNYRWQGEVIGDDWESLMDFIEDYMTEA